MSAAPLQVGVVGLGHIGQNILLPNLCRWPDVAVRAICDVQPYRLHVNRAKFGVARGYADAEELLDAEPLDAVFIAVPPKYTCELAIAALRRGIPVYAEKPPGLDQSEAERIDEAASAGGVPWLAAFNRRHMPVVGHIRRLLAELPPVWHATAEFNKYEPIDFPGMFGITPLEATVVHSLDMLRFLLGEVTQVQSMVRRDDSTYANGYQATLEFASGATGLLSSHWLSGARVERYSFHGHGYSLYASLPDEVVLYRDNALASTFKPQPEPVGGVAGEQLKGYAYGFPQQMRYFLDSLRAGTMPQPAGADAVATMELVGKVATGRLVGAL
ncbi:MAG: Gfo/Idh/MocA family oxidoreductase [Paenibacillaceae bacterium]|nr:Gfo/Idh/MocA family oxidoreductase [Paenibacillaceae bacterium]